MTLFRDAAIGFHGKVPSRGDFVQFGLPRSFTEPWDLWMQRMIAASRSALGETWLSAWLEAAPWSFVLSPGICGPGAVIGLWMPSSDRVGRCYPLTLAATMCCPSAPALYRESAGFLAAAESIGRETIEKGLSPAELASRIAAAATAPPADPDADHPRLPQEGGLWWTKGGPRASASSVTSAGLPDENTFFRILSPCFPMSPGPRPE